MLPGLFATQTFRTTPNAKAAKEASKTDFAVDFLIKIAERNTNRITGLNKPIYEKSAAYGHFGREPESNGAFSWEKTDKTSVFK